MCWNLDEEKMSRAAAFITDCSRDRRYDETTANVSNRQGVDLMYSVIGHTTYSTAVDEAFKDTYCTDPMCTVNAVTGLLNKCVC